MVQISESVEFDRPASVIWPLISQPELVASCIPGATIQAAGDGDYSGTISVKFGPTVVLFKGQCNISYDHDNRVCTIEGRGIDGRGASRALARGTVRLQSPSASTSKLHLEGEYSVNGPLQDFANAGGVHVVRALMQEFARNLAAVAEPAAQGVDTPARETRPISGGALMWKSFILACRSWFGAWTRRP
ncbi:SRPBCC family protein [Pseudorhodoplanes sp.]|uniref:SRPBCC family protein n=1 Tax=Pseudorhodoplanes sp. TaxID=1934341 RepID=UPI002B626644|nr:SRPBCC family protein [Pseudorhodoplanes sp.]HWV51040.1 SRPBCC family protein [Pseudorhodoplanes sp.]